MEAWLLMACEALTPYGGLEDEVFGCRDYSRGALLGVGCENSPWSVDPVNRQ